MKTTVCVLICVDMDRDILFFLERSDGILLLVVLGRYGGAGWVGVLALTSIMGPHGCVDSKEDTFMKTARRVFHVFVFGEVTG